MWLLNGDLKKFYFLNCGQLRYVAPVHLRKCNLTMRNFSDLVVMLDLLLIDKFEEGDRLEIKLGNLVFSVESNEIHDHFHDFCGSSMYRL